MTTILGLCICLFEFCAWGQNSSVGVKERQRMVTEAREYIKKEQIKLVNHALLLKNKNMWLKATDELYACIVQWPGNKEARLELQNIRKRAKRDSRTVDNHYNRFYAEGYLTYFNKDFSGAVNAWEKAFALLDNTTNNPDRDEEMKEFLEKAKSIIRVAQQKKEAQDLYAAAWTDHHQGKYTEAKNKLVKATILYPGLQDAKSLLLAVENELKEDEANQALKEKDKKYQVLLKEGITGYQMGKYETANLAFTQALQLKPDEPSAKRYLELSKKSFNASCNPGKADETYRQGLILYANGHMEEAINVWQQTLAMDPTHQRAKTGVEKARREMVGINAPGAIR